MIQLLEGDCREVLKTLADASVDSVVCDPPYDLTAGKKGGTGTASINLESPYGRSRIGTGNGAGGFMGMAWDATGVAFDPATWREVLRVLKPGGHLLAFSGTRTQHRMVCAIEDAGFEIRDQAGWMYGCLDEATQVATIAGVMPHHKTKVGDLVLCYDQERGAYSYQPILEVVEYDYADTAYRLVSHLVEQVVSRNHRCLVERDGIETFQYAETLEREARVPVLESLPALQQAIHDAQQRAGVAQQDMRFRVQVCADREGEHGLDAIGSAEGAGDWLRRVWPEGLEAGCVASKVRQSNVQQSLQRGAARAGVATACAQRPVSLAAGVGSGVEGADDWRDQPCVEGWADLSQAQGRLCGSVDQVRALPADHAVDGAQRRLCDGTPDPSGAGDGAGVDEGGNGAPHQPQRDGQPDQESDAVPNERRAQSVRARGFHQTDLVRVVPFHYTGKVWCLRVPTGAFVAVRNGVAFPTGNSGFPKSLDVSKAIDKAAGVVAASQGTGLRETLNAMGDGLKNRCTVCGLPFFSANACKCPKPEAVTDTAKQWSGWGTALKPAWEPICVARKPIKGTVAQNVLEHGTGALNIDGCRVETADDLNGGAYAERGGRGVGRWPANLLHDGSEEVVALFPQSAGQLVDAKTDGSGKFGNVYSPMKYGNGRDGEASANSDNEGAVGFKMKPGARRGDEGSAARFFWCPKTSAADRHDGTQSGSVAKGNGHPTVKPTELMRYLCRLVTPPGGTVLDPFAGSGSTLKAAELEGFNAIGIELSPEYIAIARQRIGADAPLFAEVQG